MKDLLPQLQADEYDVQIRQAEEQLSKLRKQRALLDVQRQLAEEQRLLDLAQAPQSDLSVTHIPHVVRHDPPFLGRYPVYEADSVQRVFKRSDSEVTLALDDGFLSFPEHVPMLAVTKVYHGVNRKEFLLLMHRLEGHFAESGQYYATDNKKVAEACRHLSEGLAVKCALVRLTPEDKRTWPEFCVWLSSYIRNFVNPDIAERRYTTARQRKQEPVSRFAALLGSHEANLPCLLTDYERCQRLWEGVLPEIRAACRSGFPVSYHTGVSQLCAAAQSLTRAQPTRRRRNRGGRRLGRRRRADLDTPPR
ncbi:hypothetical protein BJY04DRAFT_179124 [Aspergillus karnatakaensis]|uniref:uncharacterized protein n=1 Tax=Aspergillus karnatakaensis TaxID=1810916 RepID=UPI003CCCF9F2